MQIDEKLNLAFPIRVAEDGQPLVWAYHTPISKEVFTANYRVIAATNALIWGKGLKYAATAGARVGHLTLLDVAKQDAAEYGVEDCGPKIMSELKRLTMILAPNETAGFEFIPVDVALARQIIDAEDWDEAEAELVFFTAAYAMSRRAGRRKFCELISSVMAGSITSLSPTEFAASLRISTAKEISEPAALSSIPS